MYRMSETQEKEEEGEEERVEPTDNKNKARVAMLSSSKTTPTASPSAFYERIYSKTKTEAAPTAFPLTL